MDGDGRTKADPAGVAGNAPNWLSERLELVNQPAPYVTGGSGDERTGHAQRGYARQLTGGTTVPQCADMDAIGQRDCSSSGKHPSWNVPKRALSRPQTPFPGLVVR